MFLIDLYNKVFPIRPIKPLGTPRPQVLEAHGLGTLVIEAHGVLEAHAPGPPWALYYKQDENIEIFEVQNHGRNQYSPSPYSMIQNQG